MTANQRRPGFRLPWSSETDEPGSEADPSAPASEGATPTTPDTPAASGTQAPQDAAATPTAPGQEQAPKAAPAGAAKPASSSAPLPASSESPGGNTPATPEPATLGPAPAQTAAPAAGASTPTDTDGGDDFMRDLVSAMRRVAEEARDAGVADLRTRAEEHVRGLESDAEKRREDLRARADADVDAVGEWAKAEAERIKREAEQRVAARRAQLEEQLAADTQRTETETKALRDRVARYERELEAYHRQLGDINDPAAFAAAAKRMPKAPELGSAPAAAPSEPPAADAASTASASDAPDAPSAPDEAPVEPAATGSNGVPAPAEPIHPAEEEVLAARLAQLDATLPAGRTEAAAPVATEVATTEVVVKGLGSFGAITGFRQALSGVEGVDGVALSLGQTGEFVFRATHAAGFDVRGAIAQLEGDGAKIEDRPEGGLRVTLDRAR